MKDFETVAGMRGLNPTAAGLADFIPGPGYKKLPPDNAGEGDRIPVAKTPVEQIRRTVDELSLFDKQLIVSYKKLALDKKNLLNGKVKVKALREDLRREGFEETDLLKITQVKRDEVAGLVEVLTE